MKGKVVYTLLIVFSGLLARTALAANSSDYPIKVHVAACELQDECVSGLCRTFQRLTVTIDSKKYKLGSYGTRPQILLPGDYQARITIDEKKGASEYSRQYELIFPDGTTVKYGVVGESE